ncbi:phosphatase PAP2 family protein [Nocardioides dongkuii]|uniref:phosphatase PAP2 family protein n=1 Tax=Nocardioides dongkuii TaxID=2760089 RepID=UPI001FD1E2BD|nr:phosphatase PAP2 family protein [Nocardioides dongkuii]
MYRRAYVLLIGIAGAMGLWAVITATVLDEKLGDPEGSFLGPSYIRLPLLLTGALLLDLVPRIVWQARLRPSAMPGVIRERLRTHWTRDRIVLVALGIISFYITYVSYRNLKSFLPKVRPNPDAPEGVIEALSYDRELHILDRALFFGHEPATVLHEVLGTNVTAHVLSYIYLWFLPMVPLGVTAWLVWSRNMSFGYWFVTSQCIAWTLGTISYYALPTIGPGLEYVALYNDLAHTPTRSLMYGLVEDRQGVLAGVGEMQTVAGFASLHTAITLLLALMVQFTIDSKIAKWAVWVNFGLTVVATLYFGWHYVADDLAGILIALVAFYLGGVVTGQDFTKPARRKAAAEPLPDDEAYRTTTM